MEKESGEIDLEREQMAPELHAILMAAIKENARQVMDKIIDKSDELKSKYGKEVSRYRLYHLMIGSTPPENVDLFDFPEEDSLEKFIKEEFGK